MGMGMESLGRKEPNKRKRARDVNYGLAFPCPLPFFLLIILLIVLSRLFSA
jgi:hypothetical protein